MIPSHLFASMALSTAHDLWRWVLRLGGIGLIPLGLVDNSFIPVPGSMDVAIILLSAHQQHLWFYYALMATAGSVAGGFVTYRLAKKGGKEAMERKFPAKRVESVRRTFEKWGFGSIAIPALLPPPVPLVPFLFAAGAMQYPPKKFLTALTLGRALRYVILAYLAGRYGRQTLQFFGKFAHPGILALLAIILCIAGTAFYVWRTRSKRGSPSKAHGHPS